MESANQPEGDFPIQNLPFGVFRRAGSSEPMRGGVAIGDMILDLAAACGRGLFGGDVREAAKRGCEPTLNALMAQGPAAWSALRLALSRMLRESAPGSDRLRDCLVPQCGAEHALPARIGDYTDFFTSQHHALNAGRLFHADNPMLPNFKWLPIGYHGRASSVAISGSPLHRPWGQTRAPGDAAPLFAPTQRLDYELELGVFMGTGNRLGEPIAIDATEDHAFGLCLASSTMCRRWPWETPVSCSSWRSRAWHTMRSPRLCHPDWARGTPPGTSGERVRVNDSRSPLTAWISYKKNERDGLFYVLQAVVPGSRSTIRDITRSTHRRQDRAT